MNLLAWGSFLIAALLEVSGDALVRRGLTSPQRFYIFLGFIVLGCYGLVVNTAKWDFSKLLGVYVAVFAIVSILMGRFLFRESIPMSTWLGLAFIVVGGLVIQFGNVR